VQVPQQPSVKKEKRQRVQKTQLEIPDIWVQKGIRVLDTVGKQRFAGWFKEPVKPTTDYVPDYFNIVKNPMDLGTVREKLRAGQYASTQAFAKVFATELDDLQHMLRPLAFSFRAIL
jgi:hypothetical protein